MTEIAGRGSSSVLGEEVTRARFHELWAHTPNSKRIRTVFFSVTDPSPPPEGTKLHEWIPRKHINDIVTYASADADKQSAADRMTYAARWIRAQHLFRSETHSIIFHPRSSFTDGMGDFLGSKHFESTFDGEKVPRQGAKVGQVGPVVDTLHASKSFILSGHPGALYGKGAVAASKGEYVWHERLWNVCKSVFDGNGGALDPEKLAKNIKAFVNNTVWNGKLDLLPEHIYKGVDVTDKLSVFSYGSQGGGFVSLEDISVQYADQFSKIKENLSDASEGVKNG